MERPCSSMNVYLTKLVINRKFSFIKFGKVQLEHENNLDVSSH